MKKFCIILTVVIFLLSTFVVTGVQAQDETTVQALIAPFSVDKAASGFQIPKGSTITHSDKGEVVVTDMSGKTVFKTNDSLTEMVSTPDGLKKASHVIHVPSDSNVKIENNTIKIYFQNEIIVKITDVQIQNIAKLWDPSNPWIEWAESYIGNLDYYTGIWTVPSNPPGPGSTTTDYLFTAIQIPNCILQPVLEWNYGGSHRWTCAAWYGVYGYYVRATNPVTASQGNVIRGTMAWSTDHWYISIINNSTGKYSNLNCYNILVTSGMSSYCTLEGVNVDGNEDLPGDTTFSSLSLRYQGSSIIPSWAARYNTPTGVSGTLVQIISSSSIKLNTAN